MGIATFIKKHHEQYVYSEKMNCFVFIYDWDLFSDDQVGCWIDNYLYSAFMSNKKLLTTYLPFGLILNFDEFAADEVIEDTPQHEGILLYNKKSGLVFLNRSGTQKEIIKCGTFASLKLIDELGKAKIMYEKYKIKMKKKKQL